MQTAGNNFCDLMHLTCHTQCTTLLEPFLSPLQVFFFQQSLSILEDGCMGTFIISRDICCMVCISCGVLMRSLTIVITSVLFDRVPATLASPSCSVSWEFMEMKCALLTYILEIVCTEDCHNIIDNSIFPDHAETLLAWPGWLQRLETNDYSQR